jgi:hypothetical protein
MRGVYPYTFVTKVMEFSTDLGLAKILAVQCSYIQYESKLPIVTLA